MGSDSESGDTSSSGGSSLDATPLPSPDIPVNGDTPSSPDPLASETPEESIVLVPAVTASETTGVGSYIAFGCVAVSIVIVLIAILVLTIIS